MDDMKSIQFDEHPLTFDELLPLIAALAQSTQLSDDADAQQWMGRLRDWDGNMTIDSQEGALFAHWYDL
jgi:acyl-homoserine lactone acylase PvdQ